MKRILQALFIVLITTASAAAQRGEGMARIHAAKIAYITDRLRLTEQQSSGFIPIYNEYEREIRDTRQSFFRKYRGADPDQADDKESMQFIDDNLDYQQAVIDIKRKYNDRFLKYITPQQLADLYKAEREFKQMLLQRLRQRNGRGGGGGMHQGGQGF